MVQATEICITAEALFHHDFGKKSTTKIFFILEKQLLTDVKIQVYGAPYT